MQAPLPPNNNKAPITSAQEDEIPAGVTLRDFDDFDALRTSIFDNVKKATVKAFPVNYGNVRMELHDVDYDDTDPVSLSEQKKVLLENKYLTKKLRGTLKLFDNTNDELLEEKRMSLMRVPYLTNRGTFLHGGNEYASVMQSRLLPGVYTRRQVNGQLETQFNVKPGTGTGFRVGFEPDTAQYRVKISQANLHLYSLLKDLGTPDEELEKAWGPEIFNANRAKYDSRVFDKAYDRLVAKKLRKPDATPEEKVVALKAALEAARIHARVAQKNLPNMFNEKIAAEWEARWQGKQAMEKIAAAREDAMEFAPDLTPAEVFEDFAEKEAAVQPAAADAYIIKGNPEVMKNNMEDYDKFYNSVADVLKAKGMTVAFDAGEPNTLPPGGKLWVGHSRGADRLRFAPKGVSTLRLDDYEPQETRDAQSAVYSKLMQDLGVKSIAEIPLDKRPVPGPEHYTLNEQAMEALNKLELPPKSNQEQLALLIKAKMHSDAKRYGEKKRIMAAMLHKNPQDFIVDSDGHMSGITHLATGFKMHVPRNIIPAKVKRVFEEDTNDDDDESGLYVSKAAADEFDADLTPDDLREAYNSIYGHAGPRLASMEKWPDEWINKEVDDMGWLQWYEQYHAGRRTDDDDRQIKRWKSFKARHGAQLVKNPTPRRAFALRNWAVNPLKLIQDETQRKELEQSMEAYKAKAWEDYENSK